MPSTTLGRLVWVVPFGVLLAAISGSWYGLFSVPLLFLGIAPGWGSYIDMGRGPKQDNEFLVVLLKAFIPRQWHYTFWYDFIGLSLRGYCLTLPAGILIGYLTGNYIFILFGLAMGIIYELTWRISPNVDHLRGAEFGELLFGSYLAALTLHLYV